MFNDFITDNPSDFEPDVNFDSPELNEHSATDEIVSLKQFGDTLTIDDISDSVSRASDFFNTDNPAMVTEGWTTGVMNLNPATTTDDILVYNENQLLSMGITERDGLDMVMTHEYTHRMLQDIDCSFTDHQEELCCDYMAGVRAGMNDIDTTQMIEALRDTPAGDTHPAGEQRIQAIHLGETFAENFMVEHGCAPSFEDCLDFFRQSEVCIAATADPAGGLIPNQSFEPTFSGIAITENLDEMHGFVNDRDWHIKQASIATDRGDFKAAREHMRSAAMCSK